MPLAVAVEHDIVGGRRLTVGTRGAQQKPCRALDRRVAQRRAPAVSGKPPNELASYQHRGEFRLTVCVSHFPPGTSKWNKIEHRLFCHITENWRGKPLRTFETVVQLIGNVTTTSGLRVKAKLNKRKYAMGIAISKTQMNELSLYRNVFHGDWNYELRPRGS